MQQQQQQHPSMGQPPPQYSHQQQQSPLTPNQIGAQTMDGHRQTITQTYQQHLSPSSPSKSGFANRDPSQRIGKVREQMFADRRREEMENAQQEHGFDRARLEREQGARDLSVSPKTKLPIAPSHSRKASGTSTPMQ